MPILRITVPFCAACCGETCAEFAADNPLLDALVADLVPCGCQIFNDAPGFEVSGTISNVVGFNALWEDAIYDSGLGVWVIPELGTFDLTTYNGLDCDPDFTIGTTTYYAAGFIQCTVVDGEPKFNLLSIADPFGYPTSPLDPAGGVINSTYEAIGDTGTNYTCAEALGTISVFPLAEGTVAVTLPV